MSAPPNNADPDKPAAIAPGNAIALGDANVATRGGRWELLNSTLGPMLGLFLVCAIFFVFDQLRAGGGSFASVASFRTVCTYFAPVAVPAFGMTIIIIAGGIDLSVGAAMALSATVSAYAYLHGYSPAMSIGAGLLTGTLAGAFNGLLISALDIVPFIVTLGTMMIFQGCARWLAADTPIRPSKAALGNLPALQAPTPDPAWLLVSPGVWLMLVLCLAVGLLLRYSVFGRRVFALGSSEATARLCGINVPATRITVYAIGGFFAGIAGIYQLATLSQGNPVGGVGKELRIIAAVVVGGGSLNGGRGTVIGTLSGAAMMAVIDYGCIVFGIGDLYQDIIIGAIIVAAVALDQYRQRRSAA
jgi:ribose/xylose/arabinose/galactoside ABC-type transport system permease subunit